MSDGQGSVDFEWNALIVELGVGKEGGCMVGVCVCGGGGSRWVADSLSG